MIADAHAFACDLPLHDEICALESAGGHIEQPSQDGARHAEREIGDDAVPVGREGDVAGIGAEHEDVSRRGEPSRETTHQLRVELDSEDVGRTVRQCVGQDAAAGAELDHTILLVDTGVADEL